LQCFATDAANRPVLSLDAGPLIYWNVEGRPAQAVAAVAANGDQVLADMHQIGRHGWRAIVLDSEGNRIALHVARRV
jgi:predicted enzyme related to lactoylglutathione lyase